jgi:hypothetical protein
LLVFENVPYKIVILGERRKVVVAAALNSDKCYFPWIYLLQFDAVFNGDEAIARAMDDIGMAIYPAQPFVGP